MNSVYRSILITGGGGMLGRALNDLLTKRGLHPASLDRAALDIADPMALARAFADLKPSLVLNCAAHTKVDLCEQEPEKADAINGMAVGQMADLCRGHGAFLVHVSTDFVFNGCGTQPYKIDDPVAPLSAYGRSKLLGENLLERSGLDDWLIVRTAWVYGRGGANFPRTMVTAARAGKPLSVIDDQIGSPTYAADLAEAILALLDKDASGIFHFTNSGQTSWRDFAISALAEFGLSNPVAPITSAQWRQTKPNSAIRPAYSVLDLSEYIAATGRTPRPWQAALKDYAAAVNRGGWE
jgi:dTDP-4-dehydrorhamnose reductase